MIFVDKIEYDFFSRGTIDDGSLSQAIATLEELDWCLEQLETMQTHKSVSDLASLKVEYLDEKISIRFSFDLLFFSLSACLIKNYLISLKIINPERKLVIIYIQRIQVNDFCFNNKHEFVIL